ncbi:MAG: hypothetical protein J7J72_04010 [Bacteroidales bacterium]|nr:hypothetical protein [Bacteroidales bacterium]
MGIIYNRKMGKAGLLVGFVLGFVLIGASQTITEEQVTVIAPYSPTIFKAKKLKDFPASEENTNAKFKLEYYTNPQLIATTFEMDELKAAPYLSPKTFNYKQNIIKAGMGLYTTPYAELFLNGKLKRNYSIGVHAKFISSKASLEEYAYSGFSKSGVEVWSKKTETKYGLWIAGFYQRDALHYYGFKPNDFLANFVMPPDFDTLSSQIFSDAGFKFNLYNTVNSKKESFKIEGSYRYFWDRFNNRENLVNLVGNFQRPIQFLGINNQMAGIGLETEGVLTNWEGISQSMKPFSAGSGLVSSQQFLHGKADLSLNYNIHFKRFDFKAGGIVSVGFDSTSTVRIYPDFLLNTSVVKNVLNIYVLFKGGLISPSYYSLSRENPYVSAFLPMNYSSQIYRLKAGIKANIVGKADIHLWGSTENLQNAIFFTTDTSGIYGNQFALIYDDVDLLQIGGDINISIGNTKVSLLIMHQEYTMTNEAQAWYKPSWSGQMRADYLLFDNLELSMVLKGQSSVFAKEGLTTHTLDSWLDIDLGANYYFNKELSAFVHLNNILSQNYQLWYNYPIKGFGAMIGISYAF